MDEIYKRLITQNIIKILRPLEIPILIIVPPTLKTKTLYKLHQKKILNALPTKQALKYYTIIAKKKGYF